MSKKKIIRRRNPDNILFDALLNDARDVLSESTPKEVLEYLSVISDNKVKLDDILYHMSDKDKLEYIHLIINEYLTNLPEPIKRKRR